MSKLNQLRAELAEAIEKDLSIVSVGALSSALDEIERLDKLLDEVRAHLKEFQDNYYALMSDAKKLELERDTIVELHKQVIREVLNGTYSHKETQDPSSAV